MKTELFPSAPCERITQEEGGALQAAWQSHDDMKKHLIIHMQDRSTDFLTSIYAGLPVETTTIIRQPTPAKLLNELIASHTRVIMLGHGAPEGLFSLDWEQFFVISQDNVPPEIADQSSMEAGVTTTIRRCLDFVQPCLGFRRDAPAFGRSKKIKL